MINVCFFDHTVGESCLHLQFTPKYRKNVFAVEKIKDACQALFVSTAQRLNVELVGVGFGSDHVHLFITGFKNYSIAELVQRFKGITSKALRSAFIEELKPFYWGSHFWSSGYFHRTVGSVNRETMRKYVVESQSKHWLKKEKSQTSMFDFS